jgi:hypothetical protein
MKAFPHPQNVVESQRLELPAAGDVGSSLLDILEILEGIRHTDYEYEGTGPPGNVVPPARAANSGGRGSGSETAAASSQRYAFASANIELAAPPSHRDALRLASICLSSDEFRDWLGRHQPQEVSR